MTVERLMQASAVDLYESWTRHFDRWFAEPGEVLMWPEVDRPWFFKNRKEWGSHAHHGRFVELEKDRLVVTTWLTPPPGTSGYETLVRVDLMPQAEGTLLRLTHTGLHSEEIAQGHKDNWPLALEELDRCLAKR